MRISLFLTALLALSITAAAAPLPPDVQDDLDAAEASVTCWEAHYTADGGACEDHVFVFFTQWVYVGIAPGGVFTETNGCAGWQGGASDCDGDGDEDPADGRLLDLSAALVIFDITDAGLALGLYGIDAAFCASGHQIGVDGEGCDGNLPERDPPVPVLP